MQKVIATLLASLLLFPAGSFGQDSKNNLGRTIGQQGVTVVPTGTLRESAINQARLAASADGTVRAPQSPPAVGQKGSGKFKAFFSAQSMELSPAGSAVACSAPKTTFPTLVDSTQRPSDF